MNSDCINSVKILAALQVVYGHIMLHMHVSVPDYLHVFSFISEEYLFSLL